MRTLLRLIVTAGLVLGHSACADSAATGNDAAGSTADTTSGGDATAGAPTSYKPFDQANADPYLLRVIAYEKVKTIVGDAKLAPGDFGLGCDKYNATSTAPSDATKLGSLYVESATLQTSVLKRKDKHADNAGADLGTAINDQICASLAAGATATAAVDAVGGVQWHGQFIQKSLLHYFYSAWYGYLLSGNRKDWDEGMAALGKSFDGKVDSGLIGLAAKRDSLCGTMLAKDLWTKQLTGRAFLEAALTKEGKTANADTLTKLTPELEALAAQLDAKMQLVFALSVGHELNEIGKGKSAAVKLIEGRVFWQVLKPRALAFDKAKGTKHAETLAQLEQDDPSKVDLAAGHAAVKAVWGVDASALCK